MSVTDRLSAEDNLSSMEQLLEQRLCPPLRRGDIRRGEVIGVWPSFGGRMSTALRSAVRYTFVPIGTAGGAIF